MNEITKRSQNSARCYGGPEDGTDATLESWFFKVTEDPGIGDSKPMLPGDPLFIDGPPPDFGKNFKTHTYRRVVVQGVVWVHEDTTEDEVFVRIFGGRNGEDQDNGGNNE